MTTQQRTNFPSPPQAGAVVYDTDLSGLYFYNGSAWVLASTLTLPYATSQNISNGFSIFSLTNTSTTTGNSTIYSETNGASSDVSGVGGFANNFSPNGRTAGVKGVNFSNNTFGSGVFGQHFGSGIGVEGISVGGIGGSFSSTSGGYALITGNGNVGIGVNDPQAKIDIKGSAFRSHFYYGVNEDTYIRGGKAGSKVLINDVWGQGSVGIGISNPNQYLDVNGRIRIYNSNFGTAGLWLNNSTNSLNSTDGAFYGMKLDTETGIYIGNSWRFWVNNAGNATITGLAGTGNRPVLADANGTLTAASSSQSIYLQASHFQPLTGYTSILRTENELSFTGAGIMVAPINIPVGAKINSILTRVKDNSNTGKMVYSLETTNNNTNIALQLSSGGSSITSANASPVNYVSTNNLPITTQSSNYYYITLAAYDNSGNLISWGSGATFNLIWVEIDYTY